MKALSIVSPSGNKISSGIKTLEIRRWIPQISPHEDLLIVENRIFLHNWGDIDLNGRAVAVVQISSVRPFVEADINAACANYYEAGWWAWELKNIRPIISRPKVFAAKGIYEVNIDLPWDEAHDLA